MNVKEQLAKEYAKQYDEYNWQLVSEQAFEEGWDAAVDYLARLPLDKMLKYFNAVLKDVTIDEIIKENKDVLIRLKDK